MKILIAPDSFKGSLTSPQVAEIIRNAVKTVKTAAEYDLCPLADGGEGTTEAITTALNGEFISCNVHDPLMRPVSAKYGICGDTAVIETAAASGITLLKESELNPLVTTTYGTGELIKHALDEGVRRIVIGIGGSATNDGGMGCFRALGVSFRDKSGNELPEGGKALSDLYEIDVSGIDNRLFRTKILAACDVTSPLFGENGASKTFAGQKGASNEEIEILEKAMINYASVAKTTFGKDLSLNSGSGAAGGLAFALSLFADADLIPGFSILSDVLNLDNKIKDSDIVITGEGKTDRSSLLGKLPVSISEIASLYGKSCFLLSGDITCGNDELSKHFTKFRKARLETDSVEEAIANAETRLFEAARKLAEDYL